MTLFELTNKLLFFIHIFYMIAFLKIYVWSKSNTRLKNLLKYAITPGTGNTKNDKTTLTCQINAIN